jgi:hypothetical protein
MEISPLGPALIFVSIQRHKQTHVVRTNFAGCLYRVLVETRVGLVVGSETELIAAKDSRVFLAPEMGKTKTAH